MQSTIAKPVDKSAVGPDTLECLTAPRSAFKHARMWWRENALILTASVGMGHNSAAAALAAAVTQTSPACDAPPVLDAVAFMSPLSRRIYNDGYARAARYAPALLGTLFAVTDTRRGTAGTSLEFDQRVISDLSAYLIESRPKLILSTHFLASRIAGALKAQGAIDSTLVQIVADFDAHAFWAVPQTDHFYVADTPARDGLIRLSTAPQKITITGLPIDVRFENLPSKSSARDTLHLSRNTPVILLSLGGLGAAPYSEFIQELSKVTRRAHVIVACGKSAPALAKVSALLADQAFSSKSDITFEARGFTNDLPLLMAASDLIVGKPGGLTSSEALAAGLPRVLVRPIPGQETRNRDFLLKEGAAINCSDTSTLGGLVSQLLASPDLLAQRSHYALCGRSSRGRPAVSSYR